MLNIIICDDNKRDLEKVVKLVDTFMTKNKYKYKKHVYNDFNDDFMKLVKSKMPFRIYILDIETLAMKLLGFLAESYPQSLIERYKIEFDEDDDGLSLLEKVGKKRGMVISGGEINTERAAITVLDEFRGGKLGKITLEFPSVGEQ